MQYLRLTARPPLDRTPRTFRLLAASEHVERARWVSWSLTDSRGVTVLFHIRGDTATVADRLTDDPAVVAADVAPLGTAGCYLLATLDPSVSPFMASLYDVIDRDGVVLLPPVAEREGAVEVRVVGESAAVGDLARSLPSALDVDVHEIGEGGLVHEQPTAALSDRQREAVRVALELGYYDHPRRATHEAVAEALDCAPSTASEHLKKAESKLVRSVMATGAG